MQNKLASEKWCLSLFLPRLTVVRSGGLGDTLLVLPALQLLLEELPPVPSLPAGSVAGAVEGPAEITLVGSVWAERLRPLIAFPLRVVRFDSPLLTPLFGASPGQDATGAFAGAHAVVIYTGGPDENLVRNARRCCHGPVITWPAEPSGAEHAALHLARAVTDPSLKPEELPFPSLHVPPDLQQCCRPPCGGPASRFPESSAVIAVHPGSGGRRKCWPARHFARLIELMAAPILLIEGPADAEACQEVADLAPAGIGMTRADGLSVAQTATLLTRCRAYVGNDSGLSHLAAACGVPTVAVFGPTDPQVWAPRGPRVQVVQAQPPSSCAWPPPEQVAAAVDAFHA